MLEAVADDDNESGRPILLKIFEEDQEAKEAKHDNVTLAVNYLKAITERQDPELKPLEDAHIEAGNRVAEAKSRVKKSKHALDKAQEAAKEQGAFEQVLMNA